MGQKGGAIGNMLRKMWGTHCILDGNTMRTWWEHIENNKGLTPCPSPCPKEFNLMHHVISSVEQNF
jgi:hypothetical protein